MSEPLSPDLHELLVHISYTKLGIRQEQGEDLNSWMSRAVYSIVGLMASCALWNHSDIEPTDEQSNSEETETSVPTVGISKAYWKKYAKKLFYAYHSKYEGIADYYPDDQEKLIRSEYVQDNNPIIEHLNAVDIESNRFDNASWKDLINEMLDLYIQTGAYYSKNYYVGPSALRYVYLGTDDRFKNPHIYLVRGVTPSRTVSMSGLGAWTHCQEPIAESYPLEEVFNLQQDDYSSYYNELQERFNESAQDKDSFPSGCKYLRLTPSNEKFWGSYWCDQLPADDGYLSLARYGNPGQEIYFLYQRVDGRYKSLDLMSFETNPEFMRPYRGSRAYVKIASALLARRGNLPPIRVDKSRDLATIHLGYLLPPEELSFFKLYSWPCSGFKAVGNNFDRRMYLSVYRHYKSHLEKLGYTVIES